MTDLQSVSDTAKAVDQRSVMTFMLSDQRYALPIESIVQIIPMVSLTPLPQITKVVEGIINVRGVMVPIVNMRHHLGIPEMPLELHTPILLVKMKARTIGLIVDEVLEVINLSGDHIARPSEILPEGFGDVPVLQGLAYVQGTEGMVMLLEIEKLFQPEQVEALVQAMQALPEAADAWKPAEVAEAVEPEPAPETKPTRRRRTSKKADPAEQSKPTRRRRTSKKADPAEEPKPTRRRRTSKKADPAEEPKPTRRRRTTKKAKPAEESKPTRRRRTTKKEEGEASEE